jgi:hypothetical protein
MIPLAALALRAFAHRAFCASEIFLLAAADNILLRTVAPVILLFATLPHPQIKSYLYSLWMYPNCNLK